MAKKKTRILWLSEDKMAYEFYLEEPKWNKNIKWWTGHYCGSFEHEKFEDLFPSFILHPNTKCKLKLTQLKNGIKLEKVK